MKMLILICIISRSINLPAQILNLQPVGANIDAEHQEILRFLEQLSSAPVRASHEMERDYAAGEFSLRARMNLICASGRTKLTKKDFDRAARRIYASNRVLGCMGLLAAIAAEMVGSAQQGAQAALLSQYAGLLSGNSDPGLRQASVVMGQESQAVANGDSVGATTLAQTFADIPGQAIPEGYQPGSEDLSLSANIQTIESNAWANALETLGKTAMAGLLGTIQGGLYGAVVGMAAALVESSIQGNFSPQPSSLAGAEGALGAFQSSLASQGQTLGGIATDFPGLQQVQAVSGSLMKNSSVLAAPAGAGDQVLQPGGGAAAGGALIGAKQVQ